MGMTFDEAFQAFILNRKVISWGFQQPVKTLLPNGYYAYPSGYYTEYDNGYRMISSGATLHKTDIQESMILDPDCVPVARDTEDLRPDF
ncbi:MAG: hypothetical protein K0M56_03930 [Kaistella sp.]|nr:hypothetical protein [Kaistella sp.]